MLQKKYDIAINVTMKLDIAIKLNGKQRSNPMPETFISRTF
jgi:hypothetical protein